MPSIESGGTINIDVVSCAADRRDTAKTNPDTLQVTRAAFTDLLLLAGEFGCTFDRAAVMSGL